MLHRTNLRTLQPFSLNCVILRISSRHFLSSSTVFMWRFEHIFRKHRYFLRCEWWTESWLSAIIGSSKIESIRVRFHLFRRREYGVYVMSWHLWADFSRGTDWSTACSPSTCLFFTVYYISHLSPSRNGISVPSLPRLCFEWMWEVEEVHLQVDDLIWGKAVRWNAAAQF